jgi:predicted TIM-barrel fold metal-dependent hydrolase
MLARYEPYKSAHGRTGHVRYDMGARNYLRRLGSLGPEEPPKGEGHRQSFGRAAQKKRGPSPLVDADPAERIKDMELEGVDVNLTLPSAWFGTFTTIEEVVLEAAMYRAYHRWMADYCGAFPRRLKGVILVSFRDLMSSFQEIERCAKEDWPLAVFVYAPSGVPLDHPDLDRVWSACQHHDLSVALHTFTQMPPYAPGSLDTWENQWLQRSAAHPWCGMRNMAALLGSGVMDRYPRLRVGLLEAGHSWLPFWMARIDEHAKAIPGALAPLKMSPSEYVRSERYFQSIEMSEGENLTRAVISLLGEDILMYASDYPHAESWFPKSVETVMSWDLPERVKQKLFWDNAVRYYARYES